MKCLICKNTHMKEGSTILPIERGNAILLVTDIPAQVCTNCGEPYLDEETARDVQDLANETLAGEISYTKARGDRTVLVAPFA
ncbi:MAG TPA: type II toxin-antitoxin system MqsA family antitoxin [Pyrinomonadaceae bacterium]|nr:type II toxin-antitoxin system MqsA family antitoxin [Pyrinomonadaceae bacterium]